MDERENIEAALSRARAGTPIAGTYGYDHGLPEPLLGVAQLSFDGTAFVLHTALKAYGPNYTMEVLEEKTEHLDEEGARRALASNGILRAAIGLK